jgi:transaldolase
MKIQAEKISSWGENVYVKMPITNTQGASTLPIIKYLTDLGMKVNVTAIMTAQQVEIITEALNPNVKSYVSVFAGRIADTGRNPTPVMQECLKILSSNSGCELIWASPRELLNVIQANEIGCHVITATSDILAKLHLIDYDLNLYSLDTVKMFYNDAQKAGYSI